MKVLFLDIDGVLNDHTWLPEVLCGQIHGDCVFELNRVLRATDARLVVSSAWRYLMYRGEMNLQGLEWLLRSHGVLAGRLVGITRRDTMVRGPYSGKLGEWPLDDERGLQIADWLKASADPAARYDSFIKVGDEPVSKYAVVDDLDLGITACGHPLVRTDGRRGLTPADADRLIELLL